MSANPAIFNLISDILRSEDDVANQRFQDPQIEKRTDVARPYYFIRPYVPIYEETGPVRKRKPIQLGFCDEITMKRAKANKEQIMSGINAGKFIIQSQVPFSGILARYTELGIPELGPETQKTYARHIRLHIEPFFGKMRMYEITRIAVKAWLTQKSKEVRGKEGEEKKPLSHNTLIDLRKVLSAIFSKAHEWNLWDGENPCSKQQVGGIPAQKSKALPTADGLKRFLAEIRNSKVASGDGARLIALISIGTGLRVGEVLGLKPQAINGRKEEITVAETWGRGFAKPVKTDESERTRQAPGITGQIVSFAMGKAPDEYIFGRKDKGGRPPDDRDLQQYVFRPAAERAGIYTKGFGMHRFRHLNISWRQEAGASPFEAQKSAGHAQPSTTWLYTQTDSERERTHVKAIMDRLMVSDEGKIQ